MHFNFAVEQKNLFSRHFNFAIFRLDRETAKFSCNKVSLKPWMKNIQLIHLKLVHIYCVLKNVQTKLKKWKYNFFLFDNFHHEKQSCIIGFSRMLFYLSKSYLKEDISNFFILDQYIWRSKGNVYSVDYFRRTNLREQKLSRFPRILAFFAKVNIFENS